MTRPCKRRWCRILCAMTELASWLRTKGAMNDVVVWAEPYGADWARAWTECPRGDWLLAIAARAGAPRRSLVLAAAACARLAIEVIDEDDAGAPREAIGRAEAWARGELAAARLPVELDAMLAAPDPLLSAAARAAACAILAIDDPGDAAGAAAAAVETAALHAADCATMAAVSYAQRRGAELVREQLPDPPSP